MLKLVCVSILLAASFGIINGDASDVTCTGEIKLGKLEITQKIEEDEPSTPTIPEDCTELEIKAENGTEINWETIEKIPLPKLKIFRLYLTLENPEGRELKWTSISLFGNEPKEVTRLGLDTYLSINDEVVFNYDAPLKYFTINTIDSNLILNAFKNQDVKLNTLTIADIKFKDQDFTPPEGVTSLTLKRVKLVNLAAFIKKFESLTDLILEENFETIDISDILQSNTLSSLDITNSSLTLKDTTHKSETLKTLIITDCDRDTSFVENAWKIMPNLTTFKHSASLTFDLSELLVYKQLTDISITNGKLTLTKPIEQNKILNTLQLTSCEFDLSNFVEFVSSTLPNLTYLSVDASSDGTKPTQGFLNDILTKLPDIQRISLDPFDLEPRDKKGTFEIIYRYNPE